MSAKASKPESKPAAAAPPAADVQPTPSNALKVKFLRSHPAYAYHPGEVGELAPEHVAILTQGGFAELVK